MIINSNLLSSLCNYYQYSFTEKGLVIFAIRGSLPKAALRGNFTAISGFKEGYEINSAPINYRSCRCTIGLWNTQLNTISIFPGSTLPSLIYLAANTASLQTFNILCPGNYVLRKGIHPRNENYQKHNALLMDGYGLVKIPVVKKLKNAFAFDMLTTTYKVTLPGDNLHAARTEPIAIDAKDYCLQMLELNYSSSGCITIAGQPKEYVQTTLADTTWNCWETFMQLLNENTNQTHFNFVLFDYSDLNSSISTKPEIIRYGSTGNAVEKLQQLLGSITELRTGTPYYNESMTGYFTDKTAAAYLQFTRDFTNKITTPDIHFPSFFSHTYHFNNVLKKASHALS